MSIISFYSWTSIANGESVSDLTAQLNRDFLPVHSPLCHRRSRLLSTAASPQPATVRGDQRGRIDVLIQSRSVIREPDHGSRQIDTKRFVCTSELRPDLIQWHRTRLALMVRRWLPVGCLVWVGSRDGSRYVDPAGYGELCAGAFPGPLAAGRPPGCTGYEPDHWRSHAFIQNPRGREDCAENTSGLVLDTNRTHPLLLRPNASPPA